jgi:tetratricopeptide (TPR) repeat protein
MKDDILPDYRKKQQLLYEEKRTPGELIVYGDRLLKAGKISDAIEFYQKADHRAGLEKIIVTAQEMGDVMLFLQASRALDRPTSPEEWLAIGQAAKALKKYSFALLALEKSGHEQLLQEIRELAKTEGKAILA